MAEQVRCCVCNEPLEPPFLLIKGRAYCERHYALVNKPHPGFWRASVIQIAGMAIFSVVLALLGSWLGPVEGTARLLIGLFLAIVPSALWLFYFYRQDRLEPEPKHQIALVFVAALLLADVIGRRVVDDWFRVASWASTDTTTSLLASILIVGFTRQAIAYAAVRAMVYATPEFDERMDGIVYGTVAGLGVATLLNLRYIIDNGGVAIAPGVIQTVTTALAQASFGGLMGYFMAEAKFTHRPIWFVPLGFAVAAILNGLFTWLISEVSASGLAVDPWRSLLLGLVLALVVFFVLVGLMRRTTQLP
ncbi:MAG TPA: PrsW family glutamic-type intramembrane protease, partial [Roseiflexaceae bacterium]|nr:PrsW family glutamic-type intramembrane protease [Roseiflexaceae bacterium]